MATISFQLPTSIEEQLRNQLGDLDAVAKEATLVELYRLRQLSLHQFATALGISRLEADGVLKRHHVTEDLLTPDELAEQLRGLQRLLNE